MATRPKKKRPTKKKRRSVPADEAAFLESYSAEDFVRPSVAVDIVIFTILDADLKVLLIQREEHPFRGAWALPGGFVRVEEGEEQGEDVDAAAVRRLAEETHLDPGSVYLEQLYTFGKAGRDPRTRVISVAYYALVRPDLAPFVAAGEHASDADWHSVAGLALSELAFDHGEIVQMALERIRGKVDYTDIGFELVPKTFSIPELRSVYEVIKGQTYDPGNFRRRFHRMQTDGIIEKAPGKRITASKPAQVFRFVRGER